MGGVGGRRTQSARPGDTRKPQLRDALHLGAAIKLVWRAAPGWTVKTTHAKLLCRLYDPTAGAITLDGATCAASTSTSCAAT